jgi:hypothetical protein
VTIGDSVTLGSRPARVPHVRAHLLGDELLLHAPGLETAHALNPSARAIWDLCDGTRTLSDICDVLAADVGRAGAELASDVRAAVVELARLGMVTIA